MLKVLKQNEYRKWGQNILKLNVILSIVFLTAMYIWLRTIGENFNEVENNEVELIFDETAQELRIPRSVFLLDNF